MGKCSCDCGCQWPINIHAPVYRFQCPQQQVWPRDKVLSSSMWAEVMCITPRCGLKPFCLCSCGSFRDQAECIFAVHKCFHSAWSLDDSEEEPLQKPGHLPSTILWAQTNKTKKTFYWFKPWNYEIWGIPWTSLVAQTVKCLPTMWEAQVQFLGREDILEKEMAIHSSILAWKIPWTEEPGRATVHGVAKSQTWLSDFTFLFLSFVPQPILNYSS